MHSFYFFSADFLFHLLCHQIFPTLPESCFDQQAKKLLTETDMKVNEISKAVGYEHEKHFMKTFKSITGLTPSQYRNNLG